MTKKEIKTISADIKQIEKGKKAILALHKSFSKRKNVEYLEGKDVRCYLIETLNALELLSIQYENVIAGMNEEEKAMLKN